MCAYLAYMNLSKCRRSQRGFTQYIVLGILFVLVAGAIAFLKYRGSLFPSTLTASLTGSGG